MNLADTGSYLFQTSIRKNNTVVSEIVDINFHWCSCGSFQEFKFPCVHGAAVIRHLKMRFSDFVHECYKKKSLTHLYEKLYNLSTNQSFWKEVNEILNFPTNELTKKKMFLPQDADEKKFQPELSIRAKEL